MSVKFKQRTRQEEMENTISETLWELWQENVCTRCHAAWTHEGMRESRYGCALKAEPDEERCPASFYPDTPECKKHQAWRALEAIAKEASEVLDEEVDADDPRYPL